MNTACVSWAGPYREVGARDVRCRDGGVAPAQPPGSVVQGHEQHGVGHLAGEGRGQGLEGDRPAQHPAGAHVGIQDQVPEGQPSHTAHGGTGGRAGSYGWNRPDAEAGPTGREPGA